MKWSLLPLLFAIAAAGQEHFQLFTTDNGLPNNSVLAIIQSTDGYLWFTTYRGLVRFDGVHFEVFDSSNTPAIHGTTFATSSLFEDRRHALWAGTWNSGAICYQNGVFTSFTTQNGLPSNRALRIDEDEQGRIWIFTDAGLSMVENGAIKPVHVVDGELIDRYFVPPPNLSGDLYLFGLWRIGRSGLERFAYGKWSHVPLPNNLGDIRSTRIAIEIEDSQRRLWFSIPARPREAFCVKDGVLTTYGNLPAGAFANYRDRFGRLWITDGQGHIALWQNGRIQLVNGISTVLPFRVLEDSQGGSWVGTINRGLAHSSPKAISMMRLPGGPRPNMVANITQDRTGDIWVGGYALTRIHGGQPTELLQRSAPSGWGNIPEYLQHYALSGWRTIPTAAIWPDADGSILFGDGQGVRIVRHGKLQETDPVLRHINSEVTAILRDRTGSLWVGCDKGLYQYQGGQLKLFGEEQGIGGEVRALHEDKAGTLWIGTSKAVCRHSGGVFSCFADSDPLSRWSVRSITSDADNVLWVATAKGIFRIAGEKHCWIHAKDGLYTNEASAILEDANGYFWISCQLGIYRVSKSQLNAFAEGRADHVSSTFFGTADGLSVSDCVARSHPAGLVARDGTLWFPTQDGIATIDPSKVSFSSVPPPVRIQSCLLDQAAIPCGSHISLPAAARNLEISYTALDLRKSDQIHFRYRLDGLDESWLNAGTRRVAYYSHLNPGNYTFFVTAANSDGVWNQSGARLTIFVQPHFYESRWFRILAASLALGLFALAWHMRAIKFSKRQALQRAFAREMIKSQETERARIAGELHDGLGQRLALIKNMALLLNRSDSLRGHIQLNDIAAEASHALAEVRQISHNLRPPLLDLLGLTKAIEVLVTRTCGGAGIHADLVLDNLSNAFHKESEIQFYRIVQECLSNIIKHSQATSASFLIRRGHAAVSLVITDNGIGFNPADYSKTSGEPEGFGLASISERAQLLGGRLSILAAPGQGVKITLEIACANSTKAGQAKSDVADNLFEKPGQPAEGSYSATAVTALTDQSDGV